mgnify:CR=1 FL=1
MSATTTACVSFFHGTTAVLEPGDTLLPGTEVGRDNWGMENTDQVWMHTAPDRAALYGPLVYEVEPIDWVENYSAGAGHVDGMSSPDEWEWIAPSARVVRVAAGSDRGTE